MFVPSVRGWPTGPVVRPCDAAKGGSDGAGWLSFAPGLGAARKLYKGPRREKPPCRGPPLSRQGVLDRRDHERIALEGPARLLHVEPLAVGVGEALLAGREA